MAEVTVVGAGLVGSLLSVFLARRGFELDLYERRPDMRKEAIAAGRSINLAVSVRGIAALQEVGLADRVLEQAIPMRGRMIHAIDGTVSFQRYGRDDSECIYSISRGTLNRILLDAAESSGRVRLHFNERAVAFSPKTSELRFRGERGGKEKTARASVVFGTDGSASAIREAMVSAGAVKCAEAPLNYGYKELSIPPVEGAFEKRFALEPHALHIWPRGNFMLIALPNFDGTFTCTLFLPFEGPVSFAALKTPAQVESFFLAQFPDACPLLTDLAPTFFENPTGHMVTVKTSPWNLGGQALLIGDAAHAIVPFFGQGMNCGFEDLSVLGRMLDRSHTPGADPRARDWAGLFAEFSAQRRPDADSIADLAVENFVEMRDRCADAQFMREKKIEALLQKEFPDRYLSRYSMVSFSRIPYRWAVRAGHVQARILGELSRSEDLDLPRARALIETELGPLMRQAQEDLKKWT